MFLLWFPSYFWLGVCSLLCSFWGFQATFSWGCVVYYVPFGVSKLLLAGGVWFTLFLLWFLSYFRLGVCRLLCFFLFFQATFFWLGVCSLLCSFWGFQATFGWLGVCSLLCSFWGFQATFGWGYVVYYVPFGVSKLLLAGGV